MNRKYISYTVFLLTILAAVARTAVVIFNMEKNRYSDENYHLLTNAVTVAFTFFAIICFVALCGLAFYVAKGRVVVQDHKDNMVTASSCMMAFMLLGAVVVYIATPLLGGNNIFADGLDFHDKLQLISVTLCGLSAVPFLLVCLRPLSDKAAAMLVAVPLLWAVFRLLHDFIVTSTAPMESSGAYHLLSLVAVILFFQCLGKTYVSRGSAIAYYIFGYAAVFFLAVYSLPNIVLHCLGIFPFDYEAVISVVDLILGVYILSRLISSKLEPAPEKVKE